jgi:hypothetical protein
MYIPDNALKGSFSPKTPKWHPKTPHKTYLKIMPKKDTENKDPQKYQYEYFCKNCKKWIPTPEYDIEEMCCKKCKNENQ